MIARMILTSPMTKISYDDDGDVSGDDNNDDNDNDNKYTYK